MRGEAKESAAMLFLGTPPQPLHGKATKLSTSRTPGLVKYIGFNLIVRYRGMISVMALHKGHSC